MTASPDEMQWAVAFHLPCRSRSRSSSNYELADRNGRITRVLASASPSAGLTQPSTTVATMRDQCQGISLIELIGGRSTLTGWSSAQMRSERPRHAVRE
jgi:hypothetical protein